MKAPITRRSFLRVMGLGLSSSILVSLGCQPGRQSRKPNIIFIMADDLGYGDLGCYGQQQIQTPNLDRMAAEGMKFTDHYAGSTVCAPSRCVLMTGKHTGHAYIRGNKEVRPMGQWPLPPESQTVAELLKNEGYATGLIGKWGLGGPESTGIPNKQGFDYFYGYLGQRHAHNYYPEFLFRNQERVPLRNEVPNDRPDGAGQASEKNQYSHDLMAEEALNFIDRNADQPFFLYAAFTIPHANNEAGNEGMEVPEYGIYAEKDWPEPQKGLAAMIARMDKDVGRMLDRLKEHGIDEDTIVFFTSDNGPHAEGGNDPHFLNSNGPLRGIKRDLYEGGIRVPLIVRWPGKIQPGSESHHPSALWDFLPTAAELAGAEPPSQIDGISFLPELLGQRQEAHTYLYWEFPAQGGKQAVRMGSWKGIRLNVRSDPDAPIELYDLARDIGEEQNIAQENPEIVAEIERIMDEAHASSELFPLYEGTG